MIFSPPWPDPPGYRATCIEMARPRLGWAVLTTHDIAVLRVTDADWSRLQAAGPYRWLNQHPSQPTTPAATAPLAQHTWKHRQ